MAHILSPTDLEDELQSWEDPPLFDGLSKDHPQSWLNLIQTQSQDKFLPDTQWSDVAIYFLEGNLQKVMQTLRLQTPQWDWQQFKSTLIEIWEASKKPIDNGNSPESKKPVGDGKSPEFWAGVMLVGGGVVLAAPFVTLSALSLAGFSATGPVAGSLAAMTQSAVYGGATTGVFSACQSFAMTASAPALGALASAGYKMGRWGRDFLTH